MKKLVLLLVILLVIAFALTTIDISAQQDPPTVPGDWDVFSVTYVNDTTVVLDGDLLVDAGGHLYLSNTIVYFNCTYDLEFGLMIDNGGTLHLNNGSILSGPQNQSLDYKWWFYQYWGSLEMNNSIIEEAGDPSTFTSLYLRDNADIQNSTFRNCSYGLYCADWGAELLYMKNVTITNMTGNDPAYGLYLDYNSFYFENVIIDGIVATGGSADAYGVYYYDSGMTTLEGITIKNVSAYYAYGLYMYHAPTYLTDFLISEINGDRDAYGVYSYYTPSTMTYLDISDSMAIGNNFYGIYIYDSVNSINNCTISGLWADDYCYGIYTSGSYDLYEVADVVFTDLNSSYYTYGIKDTYYNTEIIRCEVYNINASTKAYGFYMDRDYDIIDQCYVADFYGDNQVYGIYTDSDGIIRDFTMENGMSEYRLFGIMSYYYDGTFENVLLNNLHGVTSNGEFYGITGGDLTNCEIVDCTSQDYFYGFDDYNSVSDCSIHDCEGVGYYMYCYSLYYNDESITEDSVAYNLTGDDIRVVSVENSVFNVSVWNVQSTGSFHGIEDDQDWWSNGAGTIFDCHVWDVEATYGTGIEIDGYGNVENCSVTNVHLRYTDSDFAHIVIADQISNTSIIHCSAPKAATGKDMDNVTIMDFRGDGICLEYGEAYVDNCSVLGVWGSAVHVRGGVDKAFVNNSDIVGWGDYFAYNYWDGENVNFVNCYLGVPQAMAENNMLDEEGWISILSTSATANNAQLAPTIVSGTDTWTSETWEFNKPLIVSGDLTLNGGNYQGFIVVTGDLTVQNIKGVNYGIGMHFFPGSTGDIQGYNCSSSGFGSKFVIRNDDFTLSDFQMGPSHSQMVIMNASNINITNGYVNGAFQEKVGIRIRDCVNVYMGNVNISNYERGIACSMADGMKHCQFEGLKMWNNWQHILAFSLQHVRFSNCTLNAPVTDCETGIFVDGEYVYVNGNTIYNVGYPWFTPNADLLIEVDYGEVVGNSIYSRYSHSELGSLYWYAEGLLVEDNYFNNWYVLTYIRNGLINSNTFLDCTLYTYLDGHNITNCTFHNTEVAIHVMAEYDCQTISNCTFYNCSDTAVLLYSDFNRVYHNNFWNNTRHVLSPGTNFFSNLEDEGNFWDDYLGKDVNGDGKGDTNLPHLNLDSYPFVYKNGWKLSPFNVVLNDPGAFSTGGSYQISWSYSILAHHYMLQESNTSDFSTFTEWEIPFFAVNLLPITTKDFNGMDNGTYFYRIKGVNRNGETTWSNVVNITVAMPPGTPVIYLNTFVNNNGTIILPWTEVSEADHYEVEEALDANFTGALGIMTNDTHYRFEGRDNDTYYYRVRAVSEDRFGAWSQYVVIHVIIPPKTPEINITIIDSNGNYLIRWDDIEGAIVYILEERSGDLGTNKVQYTTTKSNYSFSGKPDGYYLYKVKANAITGDSKWSEELPYKVDWFPVPPTLKIEPVPEGNALKLSWNTDAEDIWDYTVECNFGSRAWTVVGENIRIGEFIHYNLTDGLTYEYRLYATDQKGERSSLPSAPISLKPADSVPPPVPSIVDVGLFAEGGALRVTWQGVIEDDLVGYRVYFSENGVNFTLEKEFDDTVFEYLKMDLQNGQYYYFYVTTYDEVPNESPPSITRARYCDLDIDGDNIPNMEDMDDDGDGVPDTEDMFPYNQWESVDNDHDGLGDDFEDDDDDNDGYNDSVENTLGTDPKDRNSMPPDMDGDFIPDALDEDIDGDGYPNSEDDYPGDPKKHTKVDEDIVFTVLGVKVGRYDLLTTIITIIFSTISIGGGYFFLSVKSRRFRRHKAFIQKLDEKRELYDFFMTVVMADIEKERLKPNDAVLLRHEYTTRMEQLGGGDEYEIYDAVAIAPEGKKKTTAARPAQQPTPGPAVAPEPAVQEEAPGPAAEEGPADAAELEVEDTSELVVDEQPQQQQVMEEEEFPQLEEPPETESDTTDINEAYEQEGEEEDLDLDDDLFGDLLDDVE